jgi:hypothetical protein
MKLSILGLLLLAALPISAQVPLTKFYARFVYDDGTAVVGGLQIFQGVQPNGTNIFGVTLDSTGRTQGALALDPNQLYYGALNFTDPSGKSVSLPYVEVPYCSSACVQPVISAMPNSEITFTIAKSTDAVLSMTLGPVPALPAVLLPQTKFAACVSIPVYGPAPNPALYATTDTGGGLAAGYVVSGETYDCPVNATVAGAYLLNIRAESPNNGIGLHFEYPIGTKIGTAVVVNQTIPNWGAAEKFATFAGGQATLPAGPIKIRVVVDGTNKWALNLNWIN